MTTIFDLMLRRDIRLLCCTVTLLACAMASPNLLAKRQDHTASSAAAAIRGADDVTDLLNDRWYEVEIIVFERLNVLDFQSPEALTKSSGRAWPNNLTELGPRLSTKEAAFDPSTPTADNVIAISQIQDWPANDPQASAHCYGYPMWAERDPIHPSLQPGGLATREDLGQATQEDSADAPPSNLPPSNQPRLEPTPAQRLLEKIGAFESHLYSTSLRPLPLTLNPDVKALNRQRHLRPLINLRWRQPIPARDAGLPLRISTPIDVDSPATTAGFAKIEGYIEVTVARYLHFAPTLWYHADTLGQAPIALPAIEHMQGLAAVLPRPHPERFMQLSQSRRMRSGTLHYLDHPKIGVIVKIDPIAIPEHLTTQLSQLKGNRAAQD